MLKLKPRQYLPEIKKLSKDKQMAQREIKVTRTVRANTGTVGPKPAQPKSRSDFDDQSSVNNVFGWLKANWSKPIPRWVSPSDTPK